MSERTFETSVPARLDRLPWSRFHWTVVIALGIVWVLDGLQATMFGATAGVLQAPETLGLSPAKIGFTASCYLMGAVVGSIIFGYIADRFGRKKGFFSTLIIYICGVIGSSLAWDQSSLCFFRLLIGIGIGGEYCAVNSAIDELIPARVRGRVDLMINGSYWLGAVLSSLSTLYLLNPRYLSMDVGWRLGLAAGGLIGVLILGLRRFIPESPRWLLFHGKVAQAEELVDKIEQRIRSETGKELAPVKEIISLRARATFSLWETLKAVFFKYRRRSLLALTLMISQAFMYNAIFFTYGLLLTKFYNVSAGNTGLHLLSFAFGNLIGPFCLGHAFDTVGRRKMISFTFGISSVLLTITSFLFLRDLISAGQLTALWTVLFVFASSAASSAYLTASELFPIEARGFAIALFFSAGTGIGGVLAPWLFGTLIGDGGRGAIFAGFLSVSVLLMISALVAFKFGVDAEQAPLEEVAPPLSVRRTLRVTHV